MSSTFKLFITAVIFIIISFVMSGWVERRYKIWDRGGEIVATTLILLWLAFAFGVWVY